MSIQPVYRPYAPVASAAPASTTSAPTVAPQTAIPVWPAPSAYVPSTPGVGGVPGGVGLYAGGIAGLKAGGGLERAATSVRRSRAASRSVYASGRPRGYGSSYRTTRSVGRSRVGLGGKLGGEFMGAVKSSVIWGSVISIAMNGYDLMKNRITFAQAGANVTGDVMSAAVGGVGAAVASTLGTAVLGGMLGSGLMLSAASMGLGIAGFMVVDSIFRKTQFFQKVTSTVGSWLS